MENIYRIYTFLLGLCVGSFLNVCIYRIPLEKSVVAPRSHCPQCDRFLKWYENIPLFSYIIQGGKCRHCKKWISMRYPLVELLTGVLSLMVCLKFGWGLSYALYFLLFVAPMVAITFIDLDHQIIPDVFSLTGILSGILTVFFTMDAPGVLWWEKLLFSGKGILLGGGSLLAVSWIYEKLRKQEGIGGGDIKLAAMFGAFFGWKGVLMILFLSSFLGSVVGVFLMVVYRKGLKLVIPFGPFLATASLIYLFFGNQILQWYLNRLLLR
ncbi:MAG: prepilin peptidase [Deltaproteobacteria bacterium]|nr:MAG: prepilin peptidase [Deltaproteobacteria bacterium]